MKKLFTFLLAFLILLSLAPAARADVIWEPFNNFYEKHRSECTYIGRQYYANGPGGFVTLCDAPGSYSYSAQYENGTEFTGQFQYQDWLLVYRRDQGKEVTGWVPLSELYLSYDHISFAEEYSSRLQPYDGEFADYDGPVNGIALFEYPGAAQPKAVLQEGQERLLDRLRGTEDAPSYISDVYYAYGNDDIWGFVSYMEGYKNSWILLTNPTLGGIMNCTGAEDPVERLIAAGEITAPQPPVPPAPSLLPFLLTAAVVAVTAVLLFYFYGRKKKTPPNTHKNGQNHEN